MRILILGHGSSTHVKRPINQLLDRSCEVFFAGSENPYPTGRPGYYYLWYPFFGRCIYRRTGHVIGDLLAKLSFIPLLRYYYNKFKPDITHVHWVDCHAYYCLQAGLHPLILSIWGSDINNCFAPGADQRHNNIISQVLSKANKIIIDSPEMAGKCSFLAKHDMNTIELLHLGVMPNFLRNFGKNKLEIKSFYHIPEDARVLLSIRALTPFYQHELILKAFGLVFPRLTKRTVLVFKKFNEMNDNYSRELNFLAKHLGMENSIFWINHIADPQLPNVYSMADVIINFPVQDTFPITFLEAAASQVPVITNALPSYVNTFAEQYFKMVQDNSVTGLAEALFDELELLPTPKEKLSAAHSFVEKNFNQANYINRLLDIYSDIVQFRN